jgi:hypothetical protein
LETAKAVLSETGKYLESQQKGMDSLRARLLDIARQCTTLAALVGGALGITAVGSAAVTASLPMQVAGWVAAACWVVAALIAAISMVPSDWGYAGPRRSGGTRRCFKTTKDTPKGRCFRWLEEVRA